MKQNKQIEYEEEIEEQEEELSLEQKKALLKPGQKLNKKGEIDTRTPKERRDGLIKRICTRLVEDDHVRRMRGLREVKGILKNDLALSEIDMLKLWKGLFMLVWATDGPVVQDQVNEEVADLLLLNKNPAFNIELIRTFYITVDENWSRIDYFRLDKYLSLVRKVTKRAFQILKNIRTIEGVEEEEKEGEEEQEEEEKEETEEQKEQRLLLEKVIGLLVEALKTTVLNPVRDDLTNGLVLHMSDIYLVELYHVTNGQIEPAHLNRLLLPFINFIARSPDDRAIKRIRERVFQRLLTTYSPFGETDPWMLDEIEYIDDNGDKIPQIFPVEFDVLAKLFFKVAASKSIEDHNRKALHLLRQKCEEASKKLKDLEADADNILDDDEFEQFGEDDEEEGEEELEEELEEGDEDEDQEIGEEDLEDMIEEEVVEKDEKKRKMQQDLEDFDDDEIELSDDDDQENNPIGNNQSYNKNKKPTRKQMNKKIMKLGNRAFSIDKRKRK
ncbi:hypothetical protein DFA_07402 [Cavenderia fasciculata]|uniref:EF-hand domain-containing protein n=1 Tax=Cavenderia fasciculata TaxID=261658 RepID=F4PWB5_CACFS|nr:uncharacterized protein DFA_07402 [Cavenderia fasciculata]EGG20279.1 hypothetical protein DFA_07402 [Cavenderia fasciculata]|eukprot:XP_004367262.1 hypothetical protein DFA_07402 [Cavenderia fasciculata]